MLYSLPPNLQTKQRCFLTCLVKNCQAVLLIKLIVSSGNLVFILQKVLTIILTSFYLLYLTTTYR